jgi:hypothetical protein
LRSFCLSLPSAGIIVVHHYIQLIPSVYHTPKEIKKTYKVTAFCRNEDVHLRRFGTDYLTIQGILAQVSMAAICFVNGNGWHFTHYLQRKPRKLSPSRWEKTTVKL